MVLTTSKSGQLRNLGLVFISANKFAKLRYLCVKDSDCIMFLQWALPRMHMRWPGYRKVRRQVCKRIQRRIFQLGLIDIHQYKEILLKQRGEWDVLDNMCRITISRFYRDKKVFEVLRQCVLPELARRARVRGESQLHLWSIGCASGEEPYTLAMLFKIHLQAQFPDIDYRILATDNDPNILERARRACYSWSSLKNLPEDWLDMAFTEFDQQFCLKPQFKHHVRFMRHDVRDKVPDGSFDLIMCRNLVLTYFNPQLQCQVLERIRQVLMPGGILVVGIHEHLPDGMSGFSVYFNKLGIYQAT
jgi:chemotaxis protein methyltransferase CheR